MKIQRGGFRRFLLLAQMKVHVRQVPQQPLPFLLLPQFLKPVIPDHRLRLLSAPRRPLLPTMTRAPQPCCCWPACWPTTRVVLTCSPMFHLPVRPSMIDMVLAAGKHLVAALKENQPGCLPRRGCCSPTGARASRTVRRYLQIRPACTTTTGRCYIGFRAVRFVRLAELHAIPNHAPVIAHLALPYLSLFVVVIRPSDP